MSILEDMLAANAEFCAHPPTDYTQEDHKKSKLPQKQVAIITCMDTRLVNFLEPALGIGRGEAKVIKTAGNGVTGVFDGTIRSLLVCIYELGVKEIIVIGHHECGMAHTTSESLIKAMLARGIAKEAIHMVKKELKEWDPIIPADVPIHGLIVHPRTGKIDVVENGYT